MTPMHYFLLRAKDLPVSIIYSLHALDEFGLSRTSSLMRTPVHHYMAANPTISADVILALRACSHGSFSDKDSFGQTCMDKYFLHNRGVLDPEKDKVVRALLSFEGYWGLEALVKSSAAYSKSLLDNELNLYKVKQIR